MWLFIQQLNADARRTGEGADVTGRYDREITPWRRKAQCARYQPALTLAPRAITRSWVDELFAIKRRRKLVQLCSLTSEMETLCVLVGDFARVRALLAGVGDVHERSVWRKYRVVVGTCNWTIWDCMTYACVCVCLCAERTRASKLTHYRRYAMCSWCGQRARAPEGIAHRS